jgi:hypothetical protein
LDEIEWTHEQLNAFESLEKGEVNELIKLLLSDGVLNEALRNRLSKQLSEGNFAWHPKKAKIGRPKSKKWDDWAYIGLARRKSELIEQKPNLRIIDIEYQMADEYALNVDDLRTYVREGKKILSYMADKPEMEWAKNILFFLEKT